MDLIEKRDRNIENITEKLIKFEKYFSQNENENFLLPKLLYENLNFNSFDGDKKGVLKIKKGFFFVFFN